MWWKAAPRVLGLQAHMGGRFESASSAGDETSSMRRGGCDREFPVETRAL